MTDLLTRFVEVAPKEWKPKLTDDGAVLFDPVLIGPCPILLSSDVVSARALILLLDKLEEAGYRPTIHRFGKEYMCRADERGIGQFEAQMGATRITCAVAVFNDVFGGVQ